MAPHVFGHNFVADLPAAVYPCRNFHSNDLDLIPLGPPDDGLTLAKPCGDIPNLLVRIEVIQQHLTVGRTFHAMRNACTRIGHRGVGKRRRALRT
jgi:hypothetical protein